MIIGTAGHIDHGKTSLVKALTGVDADRLPEEKARGITLDLGYAYTPLPGGGVLGFVDVPGHERLVHNMLAGATGIDYALLVVAADDGPMPQTREHVQILELLGLQRGAVALTKIDAVAAERAEAARLEVRALLAETGLREAPIFAVSSVTGQGVAELRAHLDERGTCAARARHAGTLPAGRGSLLHAQGRRHDRDRHCPFGPRARGRRAAALAAGIAVRVRSIHAQDRPAEEGVSGQRCALNLAGPGFEKSLVERGHWVLEAPAHAPVQRIDLRLRVLKSEPRRAQALDAGAFPSRCRRRDRAYRAAGGRCARAGRQCACPGGPRSARSARSAVTASSFAINPPRARWAAVASWTPSHRSAAVAPRSGSRCCEPAKAAMRPPP